MNRIQKIASLGQSVWLDFTQRSFVASGELKKLIDDFSVTGVTSNPSIFDQAIAETSDYAEAISQSAAQGYLAREAYEHIVIQDIKAVADDFLGVFTRSHHMDGYVSLEVSPRLAHEINQTLVQAHDFWQKIGRPNLMIKVPGTKQGLNSIRQLIADGINVNVTLRFGLERYKAVADAYLSGLEDRLARKEKIDQVSSVASFFVSRMDVSVDALLDDAAQGSADPARVAALKGQAAIAYAKKAYALYNEIFRSERFKRLRLSGARPQRVLWASTSTKNPEERDVRYVEALIGTETVTTLSRPTLDAFADHGEAKPALTADLADAERVIQSLAKFGIDLEVVAARLEEEGVQKFTRSFDHLMSELERKLASARKLAGSPAQVFSSPSNRNQPAPGLSREGDRGS